MGSRRFSNQQYVDVLVSSGRLGVFETDADGLVTFVNAAWSSLTGIEASAVDGRPWTVVVHPDDRPRAERAWGEVARRGHPLREELRHLRPDGGCVHLQVQTTPVRDPDGSVGGHIGTVTDVSDVVRARQSTEEALLLDKVFEHTLDRIAVLDPDFNFVRVSDAYARADLRAPSFFPGRNHFDLYPSDFKAEAEETRRAKTIYRRTARPFVYPDHPEWGPTYWDLALVPMLDGKSEIEGFILTLMDVTERIRAENEQREAAAALTAALAERDTLLREIHHRVKNNLQIVSSFLNFQSRKVASREARAAFDELHQRLFAMSLVHERLYQSHELSRVDLGDYVRSLVAALRSSIGLGRDVTMLVDVEGLRLPIELALPVGMIVTELVTNAYKYAFPDRDSGTIRAFARLIDGRITLGVVDDGVGFPPGFAPEGAGSFGWQLVPALVDQLDGALQTSSDGGARVYISFPVVSPPSIGSRSM